MLEMLEGPQVMIIDFGSQLTKVIQRVTRELGVRSTILKPNVVEEWLSQNAPQCVIFSGGPASVYDVGAPKPPEAVYELKVPILGICYGMQVLAERFGGVVKAETGNRDYGMARVFFSRNMVDREISSGEEPVLASHGDSVYELPDGFIPAAYFSHGGVAAMVHKKDPLWGVQYHPEAVHSVYGKQFFMQFLFQVAGCIQDISPDAIYAYTKEHVRSLVEDKTVLIGYSGGVDSSVAAALSKRFAKSVIGVCIDAGNFRDGELEEIQRNATDIGLPLKIIGAGDVFLEALSGLVDAEEKRRVFAGVYKAFFLGELKKYPHIDCVVKGSIGPDFIETQEAGAFIKTHHNIDSAYIHPLKGLFKHEVREIGRRLELPPRITERQPFPGPGLFIRIIGAPITKQWLDLLQAADLCVREVLKKHGLWDKISQTVVVLDATPTVGVKGDQRVYANTIIVRAVQTPDFMTAEPYPVPLEVWRDAESLLTRHPGIVRVMVDITSKPPATIELQ